MRGAHLTPNKHTVFRRELNGANRYLSGAASSGTGYVDTSSSGRGGHGYPLPPSDLSSASGGAAALQVPLNVSFYNSFAVSFFSCAQRSEGDALVVQVLQP